jgi:hypothetical protein
MCVACCGALRYGGHDQRLIDRLLAGTVSFSASASQWSTPGRPAAC